jgi:hypothetical protein
MAPKMNTVVSVPDSCEQIFVGQIWIELENFYQCLQLSEFLWMFCTKKTHQSHAYPLP